MYHVPTDRPDVIDSETVSSTLLSLLVANLSWTAPNANNDPITEYTVSISSVPDGLSTMTCTVTYLLLQVDPEVEYNVTITATNAVDTSDPSDLVVIMGAMRGELGEGPGRGGGEWHVCGVSCWGVRVAMCYM